MILVVAGARILLCEVGKPPEWKDHEESMGSWKVPEAHA